MESQTEFESSTLLPEKEIGKEGLRKRIIVEGKSWRTPSPGDEVEVHFSGKIKGGAHLDSSRTTGVPFKFNLGQCEVIKGWDEGVATMKKGERAIFTIPPNLGYGELGSPPSIPPGSTLELAIEMISWRVVRDISRDGGILKKIMNEGEGWATPRDGDEVLVNYEVTSENGELVSKSENEEFSINDEYKWPAISRAVKTMRKGEKAELAVKFSYGYREDSAEKLEPASNLTIKVELISWKSFVHITQDKRVSKKIVKPGEGFDHPNEGSVVKVTYVGKHEDGLVFETMGSAEQPYEFVCLEEQVNDGLERAIMSMKKGEQALVTVGKEYRFRSDISRSISDESSVIYEIQLIDFTKEKPYWKMDSREKLEACEIKKRDGNLLFKAGKYWRASEKYEKAVKYVEFDHCFSDDEKVSSEALRLSCYLNNAACKLKLEDCLQASKICTKVLEMDPSNMKALYRRIQAYAKISELEKAEEDIRTALRIDPNNRDVKLVQKEVKDKQREYAKAQSEIFSSMIAKMASKQIHMTTI